MQGFDGQGKTYNTIDEMWQQEANQMTIAQWYGKAEQYWNNVEASINGVLGGMEYIHKIDMIESHRLLGTLFKNKKKPMSALDCGGGIGRISKDLLLKWFKVVDLNDQCQAYIDKAKQELGDQINKYYCCGLQNFEFEQKYDCIWIQWVASHLTDNDLIQFLQKAKANLKQNGYLIIKENICKTGFVLDKEDYSVIRCDEMFRQIIQKSGLQLRNVVLQPNLPQEIYKVNQYICQ